MADPGVPDVETAEVAPYPTFAGGTPRIVYAVTTPRVAWWFLRGQLTYLRECGGEVHLVSSPDPMLEATAEREAVEAHAVEIDREIAPLKDLRALVTLWRLFRRIRPDIVNASTPKAGLLAGLAARLSGVPGRVYVLRGLRMETTTGVLRWICGPPSAWRAPGRAAWCACRRASATAPWSCGW